MGGSRGYSILYGVGIMVLQKTLRSASVPIKKAKVWEAEGKEGLKKKNEHGCSSSTEDGHFSKTKIGSGILSRRRHGSKAQRQNQYLLRLMMKKAAKRGWNTDGLARELVCIRRKGSSDLQHWSRCRWHEALHFFWRLSWQGCPRPIMGAFIVRQ